MFNPLITGYDIYVPMDYFLIHSLQFLKINLSHTLIVVYFQRNLPERSVFPHSGMIGYKNIRQSLSVIKELMQCKKNNNNKNSVLKQFILRVYPSFNFYKQDFYDITLIYMNSFLSIHSLFLEVLMSEAKKRVQLFFFSFSLNGLYTKMIKNIYQYTYTCKFQR